MENLINENDNNDISEQFESTAQAEAAEEIDLTEAEVTVSAPTEDTNSVVIASSSPYTETKTAEVPTSNGKKEKKSSGFGKIAAVAICCSLLGGIVGGAGGVFLGGRLHSSAPILNESSDKSVSISTVLEGQRENSVISITHVDTSKIMTPAEVYATSVNSTVGIKTSITTTNYWGHTTTAAASGSGFIISSDGYIITNHHVIEDSNSITVSFYDGTSKPATLIGYDESNDIAVLKVDAEGLTPVILGDSDNLNVGDTVVAIGNPLGELTFSLTQGAVSALDREVTLSSNVTMNLIQTDCAINSGNSGGALFNLYGEVIGITNAKYSSSGFSSEASIDNIGFAIPIDSVKSIVTSLVENGYVSKPFIGVSVTNVSEETQRYGLPAGASVMEIVEDSPAQKAGLELNDIITAVDGTEITSSSDLVSVVKNSKVGQELKLKVYRQGATIDITLTVGEKIQAGIEEDTSSDQSQQKNQQEQNGQQNQQQNPFEGWGLPDWFFNFGF